VVDRIAGQDHHWPLGREVALDQRGRDRVDHAAGLLVGDFAPAIGGAFGEENAGRVSLDGRAEQLCQARIVVPERHGRGDADRSVRIGRSDGPRGRIADRLVRRPGGRLANFVHRAASPGLLLMHYSGLSKKETP
jgi:hypothetical protein